MGEQAKTTSAPLDAATWLASIDPLRQPDARTLLDLFSTTTGWTPRLWGPSIIGFGRYLYRYETGHAGESLVAGFSVRKGEHSLYILTETGDDAALLERLGPHRTGKVCLYIRRLEKVDHGVLAAMITARVASVTSRWQVFPV